MPVITADSIEDPVPQVPQVLCFAVYLAVPAGAGPETTSLSRIPAPPQPDPGRSGHLLSGAAAFACASAVLFGECRYLCCFCDSFSCTSPKYRRSADSIHTFAVNYRHPCWPCACITAVSSGPGLGIPARCLCDAFVCTAPQYRRSEDSVHASAGNSRHPCWPCA